MMLSYAILRAKLVQNSTLEPAWYLTENLLLKNRQFCRVFIIWWGRITQVLTIYEEDLRTKLNYECAIIKHKDN